MQQKRTRLRWREVKRIPHLPDLPIYEAKVPGGYYRVAPTEFIDMELLRRDDGALYNRVLSENDRLLSITLLSIFLLRRVFFAR